MTRHLDWDGLYNARDLGGLPTLDGRTTRRGAVVRSESLDRLTPTGWQQLREHGIRTVIDLRNPDERTHAPDDAVTGVLTVTLALDGDQGLESPFWHAIGRQHSGTPLYYRPFLQRLPELAAAAVAAVADAAPGGVLIHCAGGRDRTGLVVLLLLALAGVDAATIAADHELSAQRCTALFDAYDMPDQTPAIIELLEQHGTTWHDAVTSTLDGLDLPALLLNAGLAERQLAALRDRLLDHPV